ncbi:MAG: hypothetical protein R2857_05370 [Vampirovibrionales bacterium]
MNQLHQDSQLMYAVQQIRAGNADLSMFRNVVLNIDESSALYESLVARLGNGTTAMLV